MSHDQRYAVVRLNPQELPVKSNIYSVRSVVHTVRQKSVKGSFQMAGQWGPMPPNFCNYPKPTDQQPRPLFTVTGQVCIGEKWAELCIRTVPSHC